LAPGPLTGPHPSVHLILDHYSPHKHANVNTLLAKHPRSHLHFIPAFSSWLNMIERWFAVLDYKAIRRAIFQSVADRIAAIASPSTQPPTKTPTLQ